MKIGIDIDDVIANCTECLLDFHNSRYKTNFRFDDVKEFDLSVWGVDDNEVQRRIFEFFETPYFEKLAPLPTSQVTINQIKQEHELFIITSRPSFIEEKTKKWLDQHFPDTFKEIYFAGKHLDGNEITKSDACTLIGAEIMIDDAPRYITECAEKGIETLLFDRPWNKNFTLPPNSQRVRNWLEIIKIIDEKSKR